MGSRRHRVFDLFVRLCVRVYGRVLVVLSSECGRGKRVHLIRRGDVRPVAKLLWTLVQHNNSD